jgi:hypothetical protein
LTAAHGKSSFGSVQAHAAGQAFIQYFSMWKLVHKGKSSFCRFRSPGRLIAHKICANVPGLLP